jgi:hypothetical protein
MDNQNSIQKTVQSSVSPTKPPESQSYSPIQPMLQRSRRKKMITIACILFMLLLITIGGYILVEEKVMKSYSNPSTTPIAPTSLVRSPTKKVELKTFTKLGISMQYPQNITIYQEDSNEDKPGASATQNTVRFTMNNKNFVLERLADSPENEPPFTHTSITKEINGNVWKVVLPSQSSTFCDAGNCGKTAPSYYTYKNGYRYSFIYFSDDLQPTIENMLSTLVFIN